MNKKNAKGNLKVPAYGRSAFIETVITTIVALLVLVLFYSLLSEEPNILVASVALAGMVTVAFAIIRSSFSPDKLRAQQTNKTLSLASQTLVYMRGGLSEQNCQEVCNILLPECQAMAVAMTDDKLVLGYAGAHAEAFPIGSAIHTPATHRVLASQTVEVFRSSEAFASASNPLIPAGIVAPLVVRGVSVGTLKLYYESDVLIDETQRAIAEGLAQLNRLIPVYLGVLLQDEYRDYVAEIIIEGHTDSTGSYEHNLELSQNRALNVAKYCLNMGTLTQTQKTRLKSIITAQGRSFSDPVYDENGVEDLERSRRVEIKFRLKDAEMIQRMNSILSSLE